MARKPLDWRKSFRRMNNFPLDYSSVYESLEDAIAYVDARRSVYLGQLISVIEYEGEGEEKVVSSVKAYKVDIDSENPDKWTLSPIGEGEGMPYLEEDIVIVTKEGEEVCIAESGLTMTEAFQKVATYFNIHGGGSDSGVIEFDILNEEGEVIAPAGESVTRAIQDVVNYVLEHGGGISNIEPIDDDIFIGKIDNVTYIGVMGISNGEIELD